MYAIIRAGGKQAKVREGDVIDVERIKDAGDEVTFQPLLVVGDDGSIVSDRGELEKATVTAAVIGESRGEKIQVFKYKPKSGYRKNAGHRQTYTRLQVTKIETGAKKKAASKKSTAKATKPAEAEEEKSSEAQTDEEA